MKTKNDPSKPETEPKQEAGKFKVEAVASLDELAENWEQTGFGSVAAAIRDLGQNSQDQERESPPASTCSEPMKENHE